MFVYTYYGIYECIYLYLLIYIIMFVYIYMQVTYWSDKLTFSFWVKDLVGGPLHKVKTGPMYFTRGYLFHT